MKKFFFIITIIIVIVGYQVYQQGIHKPLSIDAEDINFIISSGESVKQIGANLEEVGLIKSRHLYNVYIWLNKLDATIQAGEYVLSPSMSIQEIVSTLSSGQTVNMEKEIKIIEGWRIDDIDEYLANQKIIARNEFAKKAKTAVSDWQFEFKKPEFINEMPKEANLEGFLFPDTYRVYNDAKTEDIIEKMLNNFDQKLTKQMKNDIISQGKNIFEIITMASLIEKEVRSIDDMKIVSGIFWNRIKIGQALESCATLAYILGENKKQYTQEDTEIESPYNTYRNRGLPPGPVANPGLNAIMAAIYPTETNFNYFLNRFDNGETIFSETYEEHLRNKNKYLK